jgi:hypothetical protein
MNINKNYILLLYIAIYGNGSSHSIFLSRHSHHSHHISPRELGYSYQWSKIQKLKKIQTFKKINGV